jgi:hypothetical protein
MRPKLSMKPLKPPPTKILVPEGQSPWTALAREISARPDGVVALHTMSAVGLAFKGRDDVSRRLTGALADVLANPGDSAAVAEVELAKAKW